MKKILCIILFCIMLTGCAKTPNIIEEVTPTELNEVSNEIIYNYDISNYSISEIVDIVSRYIETLPQPGDTYESVFKSLKVEPNSIRDKFYFYYASLNNKAIDSSYDLGKIDGDYIIYIQYPNTFMEMDNVHIGCRNTDALKIQMVFSSYNRVEPLFTSLTNYFAVQFDNKKSDTSGTYWYTYLYNDIGYRYIIDLTYSDYLEGYILDFEITN